MSIEEIHTALLELNVARGKILNQPDVPDWKDTRAADEQWQRIEDLDERADVIEEALPLFRVQYAEDVHSYVLVPRL